MWQKVGELRSLKALEFEKCGRVVESSSIMTLEFTRVECVQPASIGTRVSLTTFALLCRAEHLLGFAIRF